MRRNVSLVQEVRTDDEMGGNVKVSTKICLQVSTNDELCRSFRLVHEVNTDNDMCRNNRLVQAPLRRLVQTSVLVDFLYKCQFSTNDEIRSYVS